MVSVSLVIALLADRLFGEVSRGHPLVAFGHVANRVEAGARRLARVTGESARCERRWSPTRLHWLGAASWLLLVGVPVALLLALLGAVGDAAALLTGIVVLYFCIGGRSLTEHARAVAAPLSGGDLHTARLQLSRIVSRDTAQLDAQAVTRATIESVLENGSDALLAPIFWFVLAGAPGVLCYRLANTLDAMWGYRNPRFVQFGSMAARMDDVLNWLPARCCALSYATAGRTRSALRCWHTQAAMCDSPNAGPVMAAGAGALGIVLGGAASYDNAPHWRPTLGEDAVARPEDIERALTLVRRATGIWILAIIVCEALAWI